MDKMARIRAEIKAQKNNAEGAYVPGDDNNYWYGKVVLCDELLDFLDTLSKEPDKSLEEEYMDYVVNDPVYTKLVNRIAGLGIARHFAEWGAEHLKK